MDQRDWELLDKQLSGVSPIPPRNGGPIALMFIVAFLVGMAIGGSLFPRESKQTMQMASYDQTAPLRSSFP